MHTHTRAGAGISLLHNGVRPISQDALHVLDDIAYHPYGVPATAEECEALGRTCAHGTCVVLLNHGLLTLGETIHGTLMRLYMMERACELELIARTMDAPPVQIDDHVVRKAAERMKKIRGNRELRADGMARAWCARWTERGSITVSDVRSPIAASYPLKRAPRQAPPRMRRPASARGRFWVRTFAGMTADVAVAAGNA